MLFGELIGPLLRGERLGFRFRIKPSWSGKVYGTYRLTGRHLAFGGLLMLSTTALFLHLLASNLANPDPAPEIARLRLTRGHGIAAREVRLPALASHLEGEME